MGELTAYSKKFSYDHSGRLIYETNTKTYYQEGSETYEIVYLYDDSGVVGMAYIKNGVTSAYYFQKNLMGDVVAIYDTNGAKVAAYTYDAWGNCTIASNTTNYTIAHANPFRYRSYYYDEDTKLYYLKARYYSPEWRRFISPDDTNYLDPKNVNGCNMYAYCNNDPVMYVDFLGNSCYLYLNTYLPKLPLSSKIKKETSFEIGWSPIKFEDGLVTPKDYTNEYMSLYALYYQGEIGLHFGFKEGLTIFSLTVGIINSRISTDNIFSNKFNNANLFFDIGVLNAELGLKNGFAAMIEIVSLGAGIQFGNILGISITGFVGLGVELNFNGGFHVGLGVGLVGLKISIE